MHHGFPTDCLPKTIDHRTTLGRNGLPRSEVPSRVATAMDVSLPSDRPTRLYTAGRVTSAAPVLTRLIALGVSATCLTVLIVAASLNPNPSGVGSHKSLGLQSCALLDRAGMPCPSCGMTTSFTWFAHGNLLASFYVQPMGMVLAFLSAGAVWAGAYIAISGRPLHRLMTLLPAGKLLIWILVFFVLAWGWKIWIHYQGLDGWR